MNTINALHVTENTLIAPDREVPHKRGNCFNVEAEDGKEYAVVNFIFENIEELEKLGLIWPIKIHVLEGRIAIIHDERIGYRWYREQYCECCCPVKLLPHPQQARIEREKASGQRVERGGFAMINLKIGPTFP